jgi:acyl-coenzyme A thioesterase PaaI-like protein
MAPAAGSIFKAVGRIIRAGRTITVCSAEVTASNGDQEKVVAVMQATMMSVRGRPGLSD